MELVGQLLESFEKAGRKALPVSVAYDGGTSNSLLNAVLLGLVDQDEMSDYPFFRSVSVARPNLKMFPLGVLRSKSKQYISGSNDSFHCLKAFTLHHNSASRTVFYGLFAVD